MSDERKPPKYHHYVDKEQQEIIESMIPSMFKEDLQPVLEVRRKIGEKPRPVFESGTEDEDGVIRDVSSEDIRKYENAVKKWGRDKDIFDRPILPGDKPISQRFDCEVILVRPDGTEEKHNKKTTLVSAKKIQTALLREAIGYEYVYIKSTYKTYPKMRIAVREETNIEGFFRNDEEPEDDPARFMPDEIPDGIPSGEKSVKNDILDQIKKGGLSAADIVEIQKALEQQRHDAISSLKANLVKQIEDAELTFDELFADEISAAVKSTVAGMNDAGVKQSGGGESDGNDNPEYDAKNPETFQSRHWKALGMTFGPNGTKYSDPDTGDVLVYNGGRSADLDKLKAMRNKLFLEGKRQLPVVEEADKSAE